MVTDQSEDEEPQLPLTEVPARRVVRPGVWAFTVLLAIVGGVAVALAGGGALLLLALRAGDPGLDDAVKRLPAAARELPGVRSADAEPGLGDLGTTPVDIYGDVHLDDTCTPAVLEATTVRLRAIMALEHRFQWHPTVWCRHRGLTVSPSAAVTGARLAVVARLAQDDSLRAAAAIITQRGDDPSPDVDNATLEVELTVRPRTSGATARIWLDRLRPTLPSVTVVATTTGPGDSLDPLALQTGQWTVVVQAGGPQTDAVLRTAAHIEALPDVVAGYCDGPGREVALIASGPDVLRGLDATLPAPGSGDQPFRITATLEPATH